MLATRLGIDHRVDFLGHISDLDHLRSLYSESVVSVSPGYVGLSLTQSLGFGVPMLAADNEPHAPEVELLSDETGAFFAAGDPDSLAAQIIDAYRAPTRWDGQKLVETVRSRYSSTAMAEGFARALAGRPQEVPL
jgi:glycosyltransferase involved in cell wall biosynthesis